MLRLIIRQANWGIFGSVFAFSIGFFVKTYVIREVGTSNWGDYATAHTFSVIAYTFLSLGIPITIIKFFPNLMSSNREKASGLIRKILKFALFISLGFIISMYFLSPFINKYVYANTENFTYLLLLISVHVPISIFMGIITSLYRSILKIKEIILYGTFVLVPLRAIFTFIVFHYSNNIVNFVIIEIFTQILVLFLLYYFFNKKEMKLISRESKNSFKITNDIIKYGKNIYTNSLVFLLSSQSMAFLLGVMLPSEYMGVYSVLLTVTTLSMFINKNLRTVFAPIISKLYEVNDMSKLNEIYKKITFIVNTLTIPFSIIIMIFADEIFSWYSPSGELSIYKPHLFVLMISKIVSLIAGNSGMIMLMAGLERKEIVIQFLRGIFSVIFAFIFIEEYKLDAMVVILLFSMIFVSSSQLFYINKEINVSPFSKELLLLILFSIPFIYFAMTQEFIFQLYHFFIIPIGIYLLYFFVFYKPIFNIYKELR